MAVIKWTSILLCFSWILHLTASLDLIDNDLGNSDTCEDICEHAYPLHTYEKALHLSYCQRGCRFFAIHDFVKRDEDLNVTRDDCAFSCKEAYPAKDDEGACLLGCDSEIQQVQRKRNQYKQMVENDPQLSVIAPFLYAHSIFSSMFDRLHNTMSSSSSFYLQADNRHIVVIRSDPIFGPKTDSSIMFTEDDEIDDDYKTSNYIETNLASVDNSATPNLKHSQMHPVEHDYESVNLATKEESASDWLSCIAKKMGIPRLLLSFTIFMSAMMMIWLCFTTAATAPDQHVRGQKLSIYGDLEYLDGKMQLAQIHPQDKMEAAPLPIKIKVEQI